MLVYLFYYFFIFLLERSETNLSVSAIPRRGQISSRPGFFDFHVTENKYLFLLILSLKYKLMINIKVITLFSLNKCSHYRSNTSSVMDPVILSSKSCVGQLCGLT